MKISNIYFKSENCFIGSRMIFDRIPQKVQFTNSDIISFVSLELQSSNQFIFIDYLIKHITNTKEETVEKY